MSSVLRIARIATATILHRPRLSTPGAYQQLHGAAPGSEAPGRHVKTNGTISEILSAEEISMRIKYRELIARAPQYFRERANSLQHATMRMQPLRE